MAITGQMALAKMQVAREVVQGTTRAATRAIPIMSGSINEHGDRTHPQEQRESFIANYRSFPTKRYVEISGMEVAPTYEILPWFLNFSISCNMVGAPTAVTARRYEFSTNPTVNDLGSATLEVGDDTDTFIVNYGIMTRWELTLAKNAAATMTCDWLGQKATSGSFTSNIAMPTTSLEDINCTTALAYIDPQAGTIGSTQVTSIMEAKVTVETKQTQFWGFNGDLTPVDVYRNAPRSAMVEAKLAFLTTTEYDAYQSNLATDSTNPHRKIRFLVEGSEITGSVPATNKSLTLDLYTIWDEGAFADEDGLRVVNFKGQTQFNSTPARDFVITVVNGVTGGMTANP